MWFTSEVNRPHTLTALQDTQSDECGAEIWLDAVGVKPVQKTNRSIQWEGGRQADRSTS